MGLYLGEGVRAHLGDAPAAALPAPSGPVLDVGGGAGRQSFPLAEAGYDVTLLDPSLAMWTKHDSDCSGCLVMPSSG